jgi:hypothetical protein
MMLTDRLDKITLKQSKFLITEKNRFQASSFKQGVFKVGVKIQFLVQISSRFLLALNGFKSGIDPQNL